MAGLLLPICSIFFSSLLLGVYFGKKRISLIENKIYSTMLIISVVDSVLVSLLQIIALNGVTDFELIFVHFFNKLDFMALIAFTSGLFLYTILITYKMEEERIIKLLKMYSIPFWVLCLIAVLLPIEVISDGDIFSIGGIATIVTLVAAAINIFASIAIVIINIKKITKRHIPIISMIFIIIILLILFSVNPFLIIISITLTFLNYLMFFTIENPDLKMISQLKFQRDRADKANLAKSDFLSSMSHEIRTPLNAIVGLSEDVLSYKDKLPKEVLEDCEDIISASHTLLEIVGNILDLNKIESNKMEIVEVPYNFKSEIEVLARVASTRIGEKNIDFEINIAEDIPNQLIGDKVQIKGIINNLLSNAFKYTDEGKVTFTVNCINLDGICNLIISVQDTGRGIKAEQISKLFDKFERLDIERNTTTEGTGLGLAITKKLVDLMGGKINVQSQYGKGSIFVAQVPQRISEEEQALTDTQIIRNEKIIAELRNTYKGMNVLIVDDNKLNIKVAKKAITDFNFNIIEAYNGEEVLKLIQEGKKFDIILMDIMMPVMSGETTMKELSKIKDFDTPVIALTADALEGAREKYIKIGFVDYLPKPFNKEQIQKKLDNIFKNK